MTGIITKRTEPGSANLVHDPVQARIKVRITRKKMRATPAKPAKGKEPATTGGNVINIMDALKKSLAKDGSKRNSR